MSPEPRELPRQPDGVPLLAADSARSLDDLAELLRDLRRRHARSRRDTPLTYRELAQRTGWSRAAIAEYFTGRTLPPTDRLDALLKALGATAGELHALADARDRLEEARHRARRHLTAPGPESRTVVDPGSGVVRASTVVRQLPAGTALFTGREKESGKLVESAELAEDGRVPGAAAVFALDGMGGVGKTALAIHAAHLLAPQYPDGQLFLDLYGFAEERLPRDPGEALAELLASLGVPPRHIPAQRDARAALYRDRLAGTRTLVLLDNAADEAQVRLLLPPAGCLALVTSRRRLTALDDAVPLSLDVLPQAEAVALLRKAARAHAGERATDDRWETVAERCGRLPLALLIAGALLRSGGKAWSLQRLTDRLAPDKPGRELAGYTDETRSLAAVFGLSYRNLADDEKLLFRRLSLLPGSELDVHAASALLEADLDEADRLLERLATQNLLAGVSTGRYRVHDLLHAYAGDLALTTDSEPERSAAQDRLLQYWTHTAHAASARIALWPRPTPDRLSSTRVPGFAELDTAGVWLRTERGNLEGAYAHARANNLDTHAIALAAGLAEILAIDGPWTRALEMHQAAVDSAEQLNDPAARAIALADLGRIFQLTGDYPRARHTRTQALEIYRALADRLGEANVLNDLGRLLYVTGDHPGANRALTRALEIYRALANRLGEASALNDLGRQLQGIGDFPGANQALARAVDIYRALGNRLGEASTLTSLGRTRYASGDYCTAADLHLQALNMYRALGNRLGEANALTELGRVRHATRDYSVAADLHLQALNIYRALGRRGDDAVALNYYAAALAATGQDDSAYKLYQQALVIHRELSKADDEAVSLEGIAEHHLGMGDTAEGLTRLRQALDIYRRLGITPEIHRVEERMCAANARPRTRSPGGADRAGRAGRGSSGGGPGAPA